MRAMFAWLILFAMWSDASASITPYEATRLARHTKIPHKIPRMSGVFCRNPWDLRNYLSVPFWKVEAVPDAYAKVGVHMANATAHDPNACGMREARSVGSPELVYRIIRHDKAWVVYRIKVLDEVDAIDGLRVYSPSETRYYFTEEPEQIHK